VQECTTVYHLATALRNNLENPVTRLFNKAIEGADVAFCQLVSNSVYRRKLLQLRLDAQTARGANVITNVISLEVHNQNVLEFPSPQNIFFVYPEWICLKSYPNRQHFILFHHFHTVNGTWAYMQKYGGEFQDVSTRNVYFMSSENNMFCYACKRITFFSRKQDSRYSD
jgi:hypothetical protein